MVSERDKEALILRLKRIEGQLRGIQKMIDTETDCRRVAQQLAAARKGLDRAFFEMIACALAHRLAGESGKRTHSRARVGEMFTLLAKFS